MRLGQINAVNYIIQWTSDLHLEFYLIINSYWKLVLNWETERKFILTMQLKFYVNVEKVMYNFNSFYVLHHRC